MNSTVRGHKAWWAVLGACLSLLNAPAFSATNPAAQVSMIFAFDLHVTNAGVVEGTASAFGNFVGTLFGTTSDTSLTSGGTIYSVSKNGGAPGIIYQLKETDGYSPQGTLIVGADGYLYGTTFYSPRLGLTTTNGSGTVFKIKQDGTGFTTLHTFDAYFVDATTGNFINTEGVHPNKALTQDSVYVYGVTSAGGPNGTGTVFRTRKSDGVTDVLHAFNALSSVTGNVGAGANGEGAFPSSSLTLSGNTLYGVTSAGGTFLRTTSTGTVGTGTIYSVTTSGSFDTLYSFTALDDTQTTSPSVNVDGVQPTGSLLEYPAGSGVFIGTTSSGGDPTLNTPASPASIGYGTVFSFNAGTRTITTLYNFDNTNGSAPTGNLIKKDNDSLVYGVTSVGSTTSTPVTQFGVFYSIDPVAKTFKMEHALTFAEGSGFTGSLTLGSDNDLYTTVQAGSGCTVLNGSGYGGVIHYSITTGQSSAGYANCTQPSNGGGSMSLGFLCLLGMLGFAPPVRRRLFSVR